MPPSVRGLQSSPDHARQQEGLLGGGSVSNKSAAAADVTTDSAPAPSRGPLTASAAAARPRATAPGRSSDSRGTAAPVRRRRVVAKSAAAGNAQQGRSKATSIAVEGQQTNEEQETDNSDVVAVQGAANSTADATHGTNHMGTGVGMMGGMGMYGGYGSPYGGMGMYGSPYGMGGYGGMGMGMMGGPFSGLNNFLFGFQSVIFSLGQAMQILGMNTQALHQLLNTGMSMFDHAIAALNEMRALNISAASDDEELSEEELKRRRRLRTIRWSLVLGVSYAGYKIMRRWLMRRQQLRNMIAAGAGTGGSAAGPNDVDRLTGAYEKYYGSSAYPSRSNRRFHSGEYDSSSMYTDGGGGGYHDQGYGGYGGCGGYGGNPSSSYGYRGSGGGAGYFPGY